MSETVCVMAGGRGLRLHPLTRTTPKPLLRVGAKPILEQIIERLVSQGFDDFVLCTGYLSELISDHFENGRRWGVRIRYTVEDAPLGTAGALNDAARLIESDDFIVTNADVLTDLDAREMLATHRRAHADATVALALHQAQIPFGVAEYDGDYLMRLREKPIENFPVNAGIYVLKRQALEHLPQGASDMPDLLKRLDTVAVHPIEGYWCDVGTFEAMVRAGQEMGR